jgi:hypothetical protein
VLLLAATLFYAGDIGKWNDDYYFLNQFDRTGDPSTPMHVRSYTLDEPLHFWRPLYRYVYTPVVVSLYQNRYALHVLGAAVHAGVCLALLALLRRLGVARAPASIAALAFGVYPSAFEGVFWSSCTPTAMGTCAVLAIFWLQLKWLERSPALRPAWIVPATATTTLAICAANEQPAFAVLALPLLAWACRRADSQRTTARRAIGDLIPAGAAAFVLAVYSAVHVHFYPGHTGHNTGGSPTLAQVPSHLAEFVQDIWSRQTLRSFAAGALREGIVALHDRSGLAWVLGSALLFTGAAWTLSEHKQEDIDIASGASTAIRHAPSPLGLIVFGFGIFLAAWFPLAFIYYPTSPRLAYTPSIGLAIALAGVLHRPFGLRPDWLGRFNAARLVALPLLLAGAMMMIGIQHAYRARWLADRQQAKELLSLVPRPTPSPRPIFVPVRIADHPVHTGAGEFDNYFRQPLTSRWAAGWWLQAAYRREDVLCVQGSPDGTMTLTALGDGRVRTGFSTVPPARAAFRILKWPQIIPFEVDGAGRVLLFTHVRLTGDGKPDEEFPLMQAASALNTGCAPKHTLDVSRGHPSTGR